MAIEEQALDMMQRSGVRIFAEILNSSKNLSEAILKWCIMMRKNDETRKELDEGGDVALEKMLWAVQHGEKLKTVAISDETFGQLSNIMKDVNMTYSVVDVASDNTKVIYFLDRDREKMESALQVLNAKVGIVNEVQPHLFVEHIAEDDIGMINHVSDVELELFRHYIQDKKVIFTSIKDENNKNIIMFDVKDRDIAYEALAKGIYDISHPFHGDKVREHIEYKLHGRSAINIALEDAKKEFYIVSGLNPSNYIQVTSSDFKYYKKHHEIETLERDPSKLDELHTMIDTMHNPLLLTKEEFETSVAHRNAVIKQKTDMFPADYDETLSQDKREGIKNLILKGSADRSNVILQEKITNMQRKIALDNEGNTPLYIDDDSITYSDFASYEQIWDIDEQEARNREIKHYIESNKALARHDYIDVKVDERSVDYLIQQAQIKQEERANVKDKSRDKDDR